MSPLAIFGSAALCFALGAGAGWTGNGWRKNAEIADLQKMRAEDKATQATAALDDLTKAAKTINAAAAQYGQVQITLGAKLDQISKDMKNAKPLPIDCRPDDFRLRNLRATVEAANQAAAGQ